MSSTNPHFFYIVTNFLGILGYYTGLDEAYLTSQQYNCLRLLAEGKTSKEIAKELALSYRSIEHYLDHIKVKLNLQYKIF